MADSLANTGKNDSSITIGGKFKQEFSKAFSRLFARKSSTDGNNPDNKNSKKSKKRNSDTKVVDTKIVQAGDNSLDIDSEEKNVKSTMPEQSSGNDGIQKLSHLQKNRAPKPARNHRLTMVPEIVPTDVQFDKFFSSSHETLDEVGTGLDVDVKKFEIHPNSTNDEKKDSMPTTFGSKMALLPPKPTILNKPSATGQSTAPAQPPVNPVQQDNMLRKTSSSAEEPLSLVRNLSINSTSSATRRTSQSPTNLTSSKPIQTTSSKPTVLLTKSLSMAVKSRPISEVLSSPPKTEKLITAISDESVVVKRVSLKKSETIYLGSGYRNVEPRPRSISETGSTGKGEEIRVSESTSQQSKSKENIQKPDLSALQEEPTKAVLREKKLDLNSNSTEQRKSVLEMRKLFESAKQKSN